MQHRIYERAGTYYLDVRVDGKRHRRSLDTGDRKEAEARAKIALDTLALATPRVGYLRLEDALTAVAKSKTNAGTREMYTYKARSICKVLPADGNILCLKSFPYSVSHGRTCAPGSLLRCPRSPPRTSPGSGS
jgi:hypothetical protein